jgi:hypothetical protein
LICYFWIFAPLRMWKKTGNSQKMGSASFWRKSHLPSVYSLTQTVDDVGTFQSEGICNFLWKFWACLPTPRLVYTTVVIRGWLEMFHVSGLYLCRC